jgi:hypothetical protein
MHLVATRKRDTYETPARGVDARERRVGRHDASDTLRSAVREPSPPNNFTRESCRR